MTTVSQINYVAGILEGEGNFSTNGSSIRIRLEMNDYDIVDKVRKIMNSSTPIYGNGKDGYYIQLHGCIALQWMMTLYSLMGIRRREKIKSLINIWKSLDGPRYNKSEICKRNHKLKNINYDFRYNSRGSKVCIHCQKMRKVA